MKKRLIVLVLAIALFITGIPFARAEVNAASNTSNMTSYLKYYKKKNYKKAKTYIKKMKFTKDTSLKKMSKKQKAAYLKVVKKYAKNLNNSFEDSLWGYYLADLNKDKKPELLIKYGRDEAGVRTYVYTYKGGKAVKVGKVSAFHTVYVAYPGKGVVQVMGHMGYCAVSVLSMNKKNKLVVKKYGDQDCRNGSYCLPTNLLKNHIKYDSNDKAKVIYSDLK